HVETLYAPYDVNALAKQGDAIVIGTVADSGVSTVDRTDKYTHATNRFTVNVERELTGEYAGSTIQVNLLEDGKTVIFDDEIQLAKGQEVLLFLTHTDASTVYGDGYATIGGFQAKF